MLVCSPDEVSKKFKIRLKDRVWEGLQSSVFGLFLSKRFHSVKFKRRGRCLFPGCYFGASKFLSRSFSEHPFPVNLFIQFCREMHRESFGENRKLASANKEADIY